ncbi:hypothetical protein ND486_11565 [Pseudonocardia sp. DR1-2]|uniref:hypothetical protein n=1 Tax=Pseudonocardia sp. DR1-2 TaxID=2951168 RepID=UPI002044A8D4|nr:hypothetical protein [Pseudonocardia sp. DR1-2]MCM3846827.1 hypothetical protein [Pseudonocardia sp. DR1-2]
MTIHRAGSSANKPTPRDTLGGILLTIDDLDALLQIASKFESPERPVKVNFIGGHFTDANDLRSLSDAELSQLTVIAGDLTVELSELRASVTSTVEEHRKDVVAWAAARRTKIRPEAFSRIYLWPFFSSLLGIALGTYLGLYVGVPAELTSSTSVYFGAGLVLAAMLAYLGWGGYKFSKERDRSWVIVEPRTMAEYRDRKQSAIAPRQANLIALGAMLVGLVGVVVAVWAIYAPK